MAYKDIIGALQNQDCGITAEEILCGDLDKMLRRGLRVLTICNDGSGRSRTVADKLTCFHEIPSVRLIGGLRNLNENSELKNS